MGRSKFASLCNKFILAVGRRLGYIINDDKLFLTILYFLSTGKKIHWENPRTFTEKIQWLKLYACKEIYTTLVDKYAVKQYVSDIVGEQYIIPTLAVYDSVEDVDFSKLPSKFVLKVTHDSGGVIVCDDVKSLDKRKTLKRLSIALKSNFFVHSREYPYKNVPRKIIAEQFLEQPGRRELIDYKFYCFGGKPVYCQVIKDRKTKETIDFYDMNWNRMPFTGLNPDVCNAVSLTPRPVNLDLMIDLAKKLSSEIPFVRIDLYEIEGNVYFGEITFYPASGMGKFTPEEWDLKLGNLINIDNQKI